MTLIRTSHHNQICAAIVLSIVLMLTRGICGRPSQDLGGGVFGSRQDVPPLLDELMKLNANEDALYTELKKYHRQQPNYLSKWPGLRDLLLTATDYDENVNSIDSSNDEALNTRFMERLRQLAAASNVADLEDVREDSEALEALPTPMPQKKQPSKVTTTIFKDHGTKKNAQYMSPCHFKICNMGRKRNARNFANY